MSRDERMHEEIYFGADNPTFLAFRESLVLHAFFDSPHSSEVAYIKFSDWKVHGCLVLVSIDVSLME